MAHLSTNGQDHVITSFVRANRDIIIITRQQQQQPDRRPITIDTLLRAHRSEFEPSNTLYTVTMWETILYTRR